jgi:opacity protein-like surface antigen
MLRLLTFALAVVCAAPAFSQAYDREGFAVGGGFAYANEEFDDDGVGFDDTGAVNAFGSYRFHPNFGLEGRFEQTFDFEGDVGATDVDVNVWSATANAQVYILTGQFQPYAGAGIGYGEAEVDVDGPGFGGDDDVSDPLWRLFLGLDSYITPNIAIGAEAAYNFGIDDLDDYEYWTLGALFRYRF